MREGGPTSKSVGRCHASLCLPLPGRMDGWGGRNKEQRRKSRRDEAGYTYTHTGTNLYIWLSCLRVFLFFVFVVLYM